MWNWFFLVVFFLHLLHFCVQKQTETCYVLSAGNKSWPSSVGNLAFVVVVVIFGGGSDGGILDTTIQDHLMWVTVTFRFYDSPFYFVGARCARWGVDRSMLLAIFSFTNAIHLVSFHFTLYWANALIWLLFTLAKTKIAYSRNAHVPNDVNNSHSHLTQNSIIELMCMCVCVEWKCNVRIRCESDEYNLLVIVSIEAISTVR